LGSNVLQSLNGSANAIWVSHVLGEAALTATSNANIILFLMLGAVFGISMSANMHDRPVHRGRSDRRWSRR
jgi:Na+-driven multidrug efflux pump